ncbi:MAG: EAL domain-containing protein [Candidatus Omnitrophica bacterium]|nr:EAL domain-containing protein [Candidatus Omnitrophota bacterium]
MVRKFYSTTESAKIYSVYQPIIALQSEQIVGYEALARGTGKWNLPLELFRAAYEEGYAVSLDLNCMKAAFEALPKLGPGQKLFVNVEPMTVATAFQAGGAAELLLRRIKPFAKHLVFELTEGMKARDFDRVKQGVEFLRRFVYRFALDDVAGIGLKLLKLLSLKPNYIKIDMALVQGLSQSSIQQDLLRHLIELGRKSRSELIAEGIERKRDLDYVKKLGIRFGQGFYFARPSKTLLKAL